MIILTNDDGIDAPGLAALADALRSLETPYIIVAPLHPMSECSHRVTTKSPLRLSQRAENAFAVDGSPADCARIAALHILPSLHIPLTRDTWLLSGINAGGNMGHDVFISGTVAAVREAVFLGLSGIAFSQYKKGQPSDPQWSAASRWAARALALLQSHPLEPHEFWNVNFPWPADSPENPDIQIVPRSRKPLPVKFSIDNNAFSYVYGRYHDRAYEPHSDIATVFSQKIAATKESI